MTPITNDTASLDGPAANVSVTPVAITALEIWTGDLPASLTFYGSLGLPVPDDTDPTAAFAVTTLPNGLTLIWATNPIIHSYDPTRRSGDGSTRITFEIAYPTPPDVDSTYQRLIETGYHGHLPPFDGTWGARFAIIHDPDNNPVGLTSPLPT